MRTRMIGALALAMSIAATAYAQDVTTDSDPAAPFATYKTYAWTSGNASPVSLTEQRIHAAVGAQLAAKGMTEVTSNPSVFVATHVATHEKQELISNGFGPWGYGGFGSVSTYTYTQGTLVVDLYDAGTKKMVWRGVATATASDKPSKNATKIDKAVTKMFQRYPPSSN